MKEVINAEPEEVKVPKKEKRPSQAPKKNIEHKVKLQDSAEVLRDSEGRERVIIVTEEVTYTFTNLRPGLLFFKRSDGKEDVFEGRETKEDINEKERKVLLKCLDYANGWLIEEKEAGTVEEIEVQNSISDSSIDRLLAKYKNNLSKLESIVDNMTSEFAVNRIKQGFLAHNLPSSLVAFCDYKLEKIEEEYLKTQEAPVDKGPDGEV